MVDKKFLEKKKGKIILKNEKGLRLRAPTFLRTLYNDPELSLNQSLKMKVKTCNFR